MILASQSPRRIELMREAGYNIRVIPADIDETPFDGEAPLTLVERLARAKAAAVAAEYAEPNELTVAADTIVTFDGKILGKPATEGEARTMLRELSGRTHQVATGVCIVKAGDTAAPHAAESLSFVDMTDVTFYELTDEQIESVKQSVDKLDNILSWTYKSKEEALEEMRNNEHGVEIVSNVTYENNPLPNTIEITFADVANANTLVYQLEKLEGVTEVRIRPME